MNRIDQLVTRWANLTPDQLAVDGGGEKLSYRELEQLANRFAQTFRAHGVKPGDRVGIHLPRSGRGIAAMLGASRAGAVYVPLDPGSPPARMQLIVADCGLQHVVIAPHLLVSWHAANATAPVEHFYLSSDGPIPTLAAPARVHSWDDVQTATAEPMPSLNVERSLDTLAYILYTSGSTGVPKGVMISHRNAMAFVEWAALEIDLTERDRVASVAPFHFDLSVFDLWSTLSRGASIYIVDETTVVSGKKMLERIQSGNLTVWYSVPSALILMLENGGLAELGASSLRVVFFAGEVFPIKHLCRAMAALPGARFFNLFGPTETNVCTAYALPGPPPPDATAIPIGYASCGDVCTIVDEAGVPVKPGELGELLIDGPTVMLGYWDGGKKTPAKRPYPTGDMVTERPDGALMYHGRRDHMVKIHGYRVELGEVEAKVLEHTRVREAIAFAHEQRLVVVATCTDEDLAVLELKQHCAERLPRYMIPSDIRLVRDLPRTSSGKIDRVKTRAAAIENDTRVLPPLLMPSRKDPP